MLMDNILLVVLLIFLGIYPIVYLFFRFADAKINEINFFSYIFHDESTGRRAFDITHQFWLISFIFIYSMSGFGLLLIDSSYLYLCLLLLVVIFLLWWVIPEILAKTISVKTGNYFFALHLWGNVILFPVLLLLILTDRRKDSASGGLQAPARNANNQNNENRELEKSIGSIPNWEEFTVKEIMVPRIDIVGIKDDSTMAELFDMFVKKKFSRFPVYNKDMDSIIGVVALKDFIEYWNEESKDESITGIIRPVLFIPETKKVATLLKDFKEKKTSIAVVLNEYGGTTGLVTLHDLMENLVGEIKDEYDVTQDEEILEVDGSYVMSGKVEIERVQEKLQIKLDFGDYETISGYIFSLVGRVPHTGEKIRTADLIIEILSADKRKINRIKIKKAFT